jgi:ABC-type amino acid transport substrate-binding protein
MRTLDRDSLYTKPEIRSVSDLRGKVVSALSPGSTSDVLARILLQEADLVLGRDVKMLYLKSGPEILAALNKGVIDAGVIGKYTKTTDQEDLRETYETFVKVWERTPYVSTAAVQNVLKFAKHPAAKTAKPEQFIDNSILAELERSGFVNQLYQP